MGYNNKMASRKLSPQQFRQRVYAHYTKHGRSLPWRETYDPYEILVSEIMLQQTQVERVLPKYSAFLHAFPGFLHLAEAPLKQVLGLWQGLGYNRRAIALQKTAQLVANRYMGILPPSFEVITSLPGVGAATAGAVCAFAFNKPVPFIETNIRTVFLHFFFPKRQQVADDDIVPLIEQTLDRTNTREWYYALMDYGVMLKQKYPNPSRRSAHHIKQSVFKGSNRQLRGKIVKAFIEKQDAVSASQLHRAIEDDLERVKKNMDALEKEGFLKKKGSRYWIA